MSSTNTANPNPQRRMTRAALARELQDARKIAMKIATEESEANAGADSKAGTGSKQKSNAAESSDLGVVATIGNANADNLPGASAAANINTIMTEQPEPEAQAQPEPEAQAQPEPEAQAQPEPEAQLMEEDEVEDKEREEQLMEEDEEEDKEPLTPRLQPQPKPQPEPEQEPEEEDEEEDKEPLTPGLQPQPEPEHVPVVVAAPVADGAPSEGDVSVVVAALIVDDPPSEGNFPNNKQGKKKAHGIGTAMMWKGVKPSDCRDILTNLLCDDDIAEIVMRLSIIHVTTEDGETHFRQPTIDDNDQKRLCTALAEVVKTFLEKSNPATFKSITDNAYKLHSKEKEKETRGYILVDILLAQILYFPAFFRSARAVAGLYRIRNMILQALMENSKAENANDDTSKEKDDDDTSKESGKKRNFRTKKEQEFTPDCDFAAVIDAYLVDPYAKKPRYQRFEDKDMQRIMTLMLAGKVEENLKKLSKKSSEDITQFIRVIDTQMLGEKWILRSLLTKALNKPPQPQVFSCGEVCNSIKMELSSVVVDNRRASHAALVYEVIDNAVDTRKQQKKAQRNAQSRANRKNEQKPKHTAKKRKVVNLPSLVAVKPDFSDEGSSSAWSDEDSD